MINNDHGFTLEGNGYTLDPSQRTLSDIGSFTKTGIPHESWFSSPVFPKTIAAHPTASELYFIERVGKNGIIRKFTGNGKVATVLARDTNEASDEQPSAIITTIDETQLVLSPKTGALYFIQKAAGTYRICKFLDGWVTTIADTNTIPRWLGFHPHSGELYFTDAEIDTVVDTWVRKIQDGGT